ncbi:hypothetical protein AB0J83_16905 [Actinoplanes sp. NPDC049596]|uniref:hypothetical protein n=1 Tax=unclassified Actinoplanes TaxID=2626549 RepID=UPI00343BA994
MTSDIRRAASYLIGRDDVTADEFARLPVELRSALIEGRLILPSVTMLHHAPSTCPPSPVNATSSTRRPDEASACLAPKSDPERQPFACLNA